MAQLCHDQYDHPLLWCDAKRRSEEKRIADESSALVEQRKQRRETEKSRESQEVRIYSFFYPGRLLKKLFFLHNAQFVDFFI